MEPLKRRKILWVSLLLLIPVFLAGMLFAYEESRPPAWSLALDRYQAFQEQEGNRPLVVQQVRLASQPWKFDRFMSRISFGQSVHFITDGNYRNISTASQNFPFDGLGSAVPTAQEASNESGSSIMPYPPEELWCVLLHDSSGRGRGVQVVFVALHSNLYETDWIVHESIADPPSPALSASLAALGCDLEIK